MDYKTKKDIENLIKSYKREVEYNKNKRDKDLGMAEAFEYVIEDLEKVIEENYRYY